MVSVVCRIVLCDFNPLHLYPAESRAGVVPAPPFFSRPGSCTGILTNHRFLQQYWHDARYDTAKVRVWYTDGGAPGDIAGADGPDIALEPYYPVIRLADGEKPVPYHRIFLITCDGTVVFENRKIQGLAEFIVMDGPARD